MNDKSIMDPNTTTLAELASKVDMDRLTEQWNAVGRLAGEAIQGLVPPGRTFLELLAHNVETSDWYVFAKIRDGEGHIGHCGHSYIIYVNDDTQHVVAYSKCKDSMRRSKASGGVASGVK